MSYGRSALRFFEIQDLQSGISGSLSRSLANCLLIVNHAPEIGVPLLCGPTLASCRGQ